MLLDVSSIKGFLIIRHHKMHGKIVMLSLYYCIPLYLYVNLVALESGRCFLPCLVFFFLNGFNTGSAFRLQKKKERKQITSLPRVNVVLINGEHP